MLRILNRLIAGGFFFLFVFFTSTFVQAQTYSDEALDYHKRYIEAYEAGDITQAVMFLERAAELGIVKAYIDLGKYYMAEESRNYTKARHHLLSSWMRTKSSQAAYLLGYIYLDGLGVQVDYLEGKKWLELAAKRGNDKARYELGTFYIDGEKGFPKNEILAVEWLEELAFARYDRKEIHDDAQYDIAFIYLNGGENIEKDVDKGIRILCQIYQSDQWYKPTKEYFKANPDINCDEYLYNIVANEEELQQHVIELLWMAQDGFSEIRGSLIKTGGGSISKYSKYNSLFPIGNKNSHLGRTETIEASQYDYKFWGHYTPDILIKDMMGGYEARLQNTTVQYEHEKIIDSIVPADWIKDNIGFLDRDRQLTWVDKDVVYWKECDGGPRGHMIRLNFHNTTEVSSTPYPTLTVGTYDKPCPGSVNLPSRTSIE